MQTIEELSTLRLCVNPTCKPQQRMDRSIQLAEMWPQTLEQTEGLQASRKENELHLKELRRLKTLCISQHQRLSTRKESNSFILQEGVFFAHCHILVQILLLGVRKFHHLNVQ